MAAATDFLEDELLDHLLNNNAYTSPNPIHVSLHTAATADDGSGTEVSGNGYARVSVDSGMVDQWTLAGGGAGLADNTNDITFPQATGNQGTVTHTAIFDAASMGNMLIHGALTTSRDVLDGDTFEFQAGDFDVTIA